MIQIQNNFDHRNNSHNDRCQNAQTNKLATRAVQKKYLKTTSAPEPLVKIQHNFTEIIHIMPLAKNANVFASVNNVAARALDKVYLKMTSQNSFTEMFLIMPSAKIYQKVLLCKTSRLPDL